MNKKALAILEHLAHRWETRCDDSDENTGFLIRGAWLKKAAQAIAELETTPAIDPLASTVEAGSMDELAQED